MEVELMDLVGFTILWCCGIVSGAGDTVTSYESQGGI